MAELKTINMGEIKTEPINWLWKPYIPLGKITLLQGDGGEGKTTIAMAIASAVTTGSSLPSSCAGRDIGCSVTLPANVIIQNAEDSYSQTIKPRLEQFGADCSRIEVIDEGERELSFADDRIEKAIIKFKAKLVIIDPVQAYFGGANMNSTDAVRPLMKYLGAVAERNDCAILLVGHLHKAGGKASYRGLGSIDIYNAARSVLTVGHIDEDEPIRAMVHNKNNLAPKGESLTFNFDPLTGFSWLGECGITIDELLKGKADEKKISQLDTAKGLITSTLEQSPVSAAAIFDLGNKMGLSKATMKRAKSELGITSEKKREGWLWTKEGTQEVHADMVNPLTPLSQLDYATEAAIYGFHMD